MGPCTPATLTMPEEPDITSPAVDAQLDETVDQTVTWTVPTTTPGNARLRVGPQTSADETAHLFDVDPGSGSGTIPANILADDLVAGDFLDGGVIKLEFYELDNLSDDTLHPESRFEVVAADEVDGIGTQE